MRLYVIGIGPGDPELLTIKAKKFIENTKLLFYPTGGKNRIALSVIEKVVNLRNKELVPLHFPMKKTRDSDFASHWKGLSERILEGLKLHKSGVFITIGDPSFYCTFFYLYPFLKEKIEVKIIPGVSSINACACAIPLSLALGDETIAIIPANYVNKIKELLHQFDTVIFMKPHKSLKELNEFLNGSKFKVWIVKGVSTREEKIISGVSGLRADKVNYFTTVIARKE